MSIRSSSFKFHVSCSKLDNLKPETSNLKPTSHGFTLIELVLFIAIVGAGVAGVLIAYDFAARGSADPVVKKQALAIAESLLEEIQQMPFTYCDPDDPAVSTATSPAGCATPEALGPEAGETRYDPNTPFDNVNDYHLFAMNPIRDIGNNVITGLNLYTASVIVTPAVYGGIPNTDALLITVTVAGPGSVTVNVDGYRTRYAPNL